MSRVLIDSNVFVYAFDPADRAKHEKAVRLIEGVTAEPPHLVAAEKLAPDLIVDDFRQAEPYSASGLPSHPFTAFVGNLSRMIIQKENSLRLEGGS